MLKLLNRLETIANTKNNQIAYIIKDKKITYKDLWDKSNNLANSLVKQGNEPVIIYGHKSIDMIISILACLISNRTYIPVDLYNPISRIQEITKLTGATLLIKNEEINYSDIESLNIDEIISKYLIKEKAFDTNKNKLAYIIFTSGSTGNPKGVPISYKNLENFFEWINKILPREKNKSYKILNQASFSFDLSVVDLYYSLFNGYTLVGTNKEDQKDLNKVLEIISEEKINITVMTPTFVKMLLLDKDFNSNNFKDLECMYFCGEQLEVITAKKLLERFNDIKLINAYGPTEATSAVIGIYIQDEMLNYKYLPVGDLNYSAVNIEIENEEIILKGESVFNGYLGNIVDGYYKDGNINCYRTGDIGYIENNYLYCIGRKDSQIKFMGYRIEIGDIENNLLKVDGVKEAVVVPRYKDNTNIVKGLKAFITIDRQIDVAYIKNSLEKLLPQYMIPNNIIILEKMPVNENGKYDRKKLNNL